MGAPDTLYHAEGCEHCNGSGYQGRIGLYELVTVGDRLRGLIHRDEGEDALAAEAFRNTDSLMQSGLRHVAAGLTSLEEVVRVSSQRVE